MFQRTKLALIASVATAAFSLSASAAEEAPRGYRAYSVKVSYGDLDLTTANDARVMLDRLDRAAFAVCGGNERFYAEYKTRSGRVAKAFRDCREDALARAVATVDSQKLWYAFGAQ
jgi:UrcA family protein